MFTFRSSSLWKIFQRKVSNGLKFIYYIRRNWTTLVWNITSRKFILGCKEAVLKINKFEVSVGLLTNVGHFWKRKRSWIVVKLVVEQNCLKELHFILRFCQLQSICWKILYTKRLNVFMLRQWLRPFEVIVFRTRKIYQCVLCNGPNISQ